MWKLTHQVAPEAIAVYDAAANCLTSAYKPTKNNYYIKKIVKRLASCISTEYHYVYAVYHFQMQQDAMLSQGEPRDAAISFDTTALNGIVHAVTLAQHGFLV